jgi:tetratricopeptide (TPR) repeat protein
MSREPGMAAISNPHAATPAALCEIGFRHLQDNRPLDAQLCCQHALAIEADHADALHLMGLLALQGGQQDHAVEWLTRAIRKDPKTAYLATLGIALKQMGRAEESLKVFDKAVQLKPDDAELWKHLGGVLHALDRPAEALLSYQHALHLDPGLWEAAYHSGVILHRMERLEDALVQLDRCVKLRPEDTAALQQRAFVLRGLKRFEACLADNMSICALGPASAINYNNVGDALQLLGRHQEGLGWFDKALELEPDAVEILCNRGFALKNMNRNDEAIASFERGIALDPDNARAIFDLSFLLLVTGQFETGWAAREARWGLPRFSARFSDAKWLGEEPIDGKTLLVWADEGFGDTIQFARYAPRLAERGARVILLAQDALQPLLAGAPGISQCLPLSTREIPPFDRQCPIMSVPLALGARLETIPTAQYLPPLPAQRVQAWRDLLGPHDRLRVGLVWSGNAKHGEDRNRSMPFARLMPLLSADATFVSLQKEPRPDDKTLLAECKSILDPSAELRDYVDTAALISCLDLVITVDTSVAHLAGTLGRPTWVMLSYVADWRWLTSRDDCPWYPTARLFRQDATRDYGAVVDRVRAELVGMISRFERASKT